MSEITREQVYEEMREMLGLVPGFFAAVPDRTLALEWELFKRVQIEESPIPPKYRELIGLGLSAISKCRYCALFHTEMARLHGATDEEIEDAVHYAKSSAGWSAYLNGLQVDYEQFRRELEQVVEHVRNAQEVPAAVI